MVRRTREEDQARRFKVGIMGMMGIMEEALRRRRMQAGVHLHKKPAIQGTGHTKQMPAKEVDRHEGQGNLKDGILFTNRC
jgi:hypothetical protein